MVVLAETESAGGAVVVGGVVDSDVTAAGVEVVRVVGEGDRVDTDAVLGEQASTRRVQPATRISKRRIASR